MKKSITIGFILIVISILFSGLAIAKDHCTNSGGGHDVPTPFGVSNTKFELADGEIYSLSGRVFFNYFVIDLEKYPWLANSKRVEAPYFLLEGTGTDWTQWKYTPLKGIFKAHGRISTVGGAPEYGVTLELLAVVD